MTKHFRFFLLIVLLMLPAVRAEDQRVIHVAAASSLRGPVEALVSEFEQHFPRYDVSVSYAASGKLVAQVQHGAPYAVLIAADPDYLQVLFRAGHTLAEPEVVGFGPVVLWHPGQQGGVADLLQQARHIALAQPRHAPYGKAALQYLQQQMPAAVYQDKLVYGENVAQTAHRIHMGAAEVGFVALSQVRQLKIPRSEYTLLPEIAPLAQTIALTKKADQQPGAALLYQEFFANGSQALLASFGYLPARGDEASGDAASE